jgi:hypothetical protein
MTDIRTALAGNSLADGQSVQMDGGALTLTRMGDKFIVRENNGDQMWLFDNSMNTFAALTDTDGDGDYDAEWKSWGDPHVVTETNISGITDAASLSDYISNTPLKTDYDVQTNYTLRDKESVVSMVTESWNGSQDVVVNDKGTVAYIGNDGQMHDFSFDFGTLGSGTGVSFTEDATHSTQDLQMSGQPLTNLAWNPTTEAGDDLFVIAGSGQWQKMELGTHIGTQGQVVAGKLVAPWVGEYTAQADFEDDETTRALAEFRTNLVRGSALKLKDDEDDNDEEADIKSSEIVKGAINNTIVAPVNSTININL